MERGRTTVKILFPTVASKWDLTNPLFLFYSQLEGEQVNEPGEMTKEQLDYIEEHKKKRNVREQDTKVLTNPPTFIGVGHHVRMGKRAARYSSTSTYLTNIEPAFDT